MIAEPLNILLSCSGLSMLMFYSVTIFEEAGAAVDKLQASLLVSAFRVVIAVLSSLALFKLPRRALFLSSTLLVCLAMFSLGLFFYLRSQDRDITECLIKSITAQISVTRVHKVSTGPKISNQEVRALIRISLISGFLQGVL